MDGSRPSRTALSAARLRAAHQVLEAGAVLRDPLAVRILGESERQVAREARAHPERRSMRWFVCARARLAEDVTDACVRAGVTQLVILGAGLDTYGYRRPHPNLAVTEVDHPATQQWKRDMLRAAAIPSSGVGYLPVDFEHGDLGAALATAVDTSRPLLFWWLGVTPYLSEDAITATLSTLGATPSSAVVFDHASPLGEIAETERHAHQQRRDRVAAIGEPWLSEYLPGDIAALARRCGFEDADSVHEIAVIDRALGRSPSAVRGPAHLVVAARGWPVRDLVARTILGTSS